jgi:very-short-patch-repair endonuclease
MGTESVKRCEICDSQLENERWPKCLSCYEDSKKISALTKDSETITEEQKRLYLALKAKNWEPELEYEDHYAEGKYKTVDIAILSARLFIEVNGSQHVEDCKQLKKDLWRSHFSFNKGFLTLSVFNKAINTTEFHRIVNVIDRIAKERKRQIIEQEKTELIS